MKTQTDRQTNIWIDEAVTPHLYYRQTEPYIYIFHERERERERERMIKISQP